MEKLFSWGVTSFVVSIAIAFALGTLALNDYGLAKFFFVVATADAVGGAIIGINHSGFRAWLQGVLLFAAGGCICVLLYLSFRYVDSKKSELQPATPALHVSPTQTPTTSAQLANQPETARLTKHAAKHPSSIHVPEPRPDYISQHEAEWAQPIRQNPATTVNVEPGAVASFGQQGGITASQVNILNQGEPIAKITYSQTGNAVTIKTSGRIEPISLVLFFDVDVDLVSDGLGTCMMCGNGRLNDSSGIPDKKTIWIFRSEPPFLPDNPITVIFSSKSSARLLKVEVGPRGPS